ncbi:SspB family protein [Rubellimicrobium mesophilum]|nr:ClpXP protease specificity-enhancing factor SspB [Rubellimicrobium mesophilum]
MTRSIDYGNLMHRAMRGLIHEVLADVAANGLPGKHHFFITFDTQHPDVEIADWLSDRYPGEMTIVLQHWFADLETSDEGFSVTLNFGDNPEPLYIPWDAIKTFVDPSVEFGLRFETQSHAASAEPETPPPGGDRSKAEAKPEAKPDRSGAEVLSLDKFRK